MERCCGQAAMVHADHVNSWWGVELLTPLLKHTNEFYFCVKIPCVTDANTWEVTPPINTSSSGGRRSTQSLHEAVSKIGLGDSQQRVTRSGNGVTTKRPTGFTTSKGW